MDTFLYLDTDYSLLYTVSYIYEILYVLYIYIYVYDVEYVKSGNPLEKSTKLGSSQSYP